MFDRLMRAVVALVGGVLLAFLPVTGASALWNVGEAPNAEWSSSTLVTADKREDLDSLEGREELTVDGTPYNVISLYVTGLGGKSVTEEPPVDGGLSGDVHVTIEADGIEMIENDINVFADPSHSVGAEGEEGVYIADVPADGVVAVTLTVPVEDMGKVQVVGPYRSDAVWYYAKATRASDGAYDSMVRSLSGESESAPSSEPVESPPSQESGESGESQVDAAPVSGRGAGARGGVRGWRGGCAAVGCCGWRGAVEAAEGFSGRLICSGFMGSERPAPMLVRGARCVSGDGEEGWV